MAANQKKKGFNKNVLLVLLLAPVLVLVGMVAGYYVLSLGNNGDGARAEQQLEEEVVVPMEEFLVNLNPSSNTNDYIRMTIAMGTRHKEGEKILEANLARVRDTVIYTTNRQTKDSLFDDRGRLVLKTILLEEINEALGMEIVSNLYVTEFIVQ